MEETGSWSHFSPAASHHLPNSAHRTIPAIPESTFLGEIGPNSALQLTVNDVVRMKNKKESRHPHPPDLLQPSAHFEFRWLRPDQVQGEWATHRSSVSMKTSSQWLIHLSSHCFSVLVAPRSSRTSTVLLTVVQKKKMKYVN